VTFPIRPQFRNAVGLGLKELARIVRQYAIIRETFFARTVSWAPDFRSGRLRIRGSKRRRRDELAGEGIVSPETEVLLMLGLFACGAVTGLLSRWGPLSGWAALAFPAVLLPLGIGLTRLFC
jgi:hypothetical protein